MSVFSEMFHNKLGAKPMNFGELYPDNTVEGVQGEWRAVRYLGIIYYRMEVDYELEEDVPNVDIMLATAVKMENQQFELCQDFNKLDLCDHMFISMFMGLKDSMIAYLAGAGWKKKDILKTAQGYCKQLRIYVGKYGWY